MLFATVLLCPVLAAIGVGPIFTLPFLAGILLWVVLKPVHPLWLYLSSALFLAVIASIAFVLSPAASRVSDEPETRGRVRWVGTASSALTLCIAALMVLRPSWP